MIRLAVAAVIVALGLISQVPVARAQAEELCGGSIVGPSMVWERERARCPWPFNLDVTTVICRETQVRGLYATFIQAGWELIALNGSARVFAQSGRLGRDDLERILARPNVGPWIAAANRFCELRYGGH
jgi:hypothetical protein